MGSAFVRLANKHRAIGADGRLRLSIEARGGLSVAFAIEPPQSTATADVLLPELADNSCAAILPGLPGFGDAVGSACGQFYPRRCGFRFGTLESWIDRDNLTSARQPA